MQTRLTILRSLKKANKTFFECKCKCGTVKMIRADNVLSGATLSCGCLNREKASERLKKLHRDYHMSTKRQNDKNLNQL